MATPRKRWGYVDGQELNRALRANRKARRVMDDLLEQARERAGAGWIWPFLAALGQELGVMLEALSVMEQIRQEVRSEYDTGADGEEVGEGASRG